MLQDIAAMRTHGTIPEADARTRACIIPTSVNGIVAVTLFDTGSTLSVISEDLAQRLESAGRLRRYPSKMSAKLFGDRNVVTFHHAATVEIALGPVVIQQEVQVLRGLSFDCLLGDNFFQQAVPTIDYGNRVVYAGGIGLPFMRRGDMISMFAYLMDLPPTADQ
jgi:hypothetical protein